MTIFDSAIFDIRVFDAEIPDHPIRYGHSRKYRRGWHYNQLSTTNTTEYRRYTKTPTDATTVAFTSETEAHTPVFTPEA